MSNRQLDTLHAHQSLHSTIDNQHQFGACKQSVRYVSDVWTLSITRSTCIVNNLLWKARASQRCSSRYARLLAAKSDSQIEQTATPDADALPLSPTKTRSLTRAQLRITNRSLSQVLHGLATSPSASSSSSWTAACFASRPLPFARRHPLPSPSPLPPATRLPQWLQPAPSLQPPPL